MPTHMIKSPFNSDNVTSQEFKEFKGFVSDGFDSMEELVTNSKIEIVSTVTDRLSAVMDEKISASEKRIITRIDKMNGTIGNLGGRVGLLETGMKRLNTKVDTLETNLKGIDAKVDTLNNRMNVFGDQFSLLLTIVQKIADKIL